MGTLPTSDRSMGRRDRRRLMKNNNSQQLIVAKMIKDITLKTVQYQTLAIVLHMVIFRDFYVGNKYQFLI